MKTGRYWINSPSELQPCHKMHGKKVIAISYNATDSTCYFIEGNTISAILPNYALSPGWPESPSAPNFRSENEERQKAALGSASGGAAESPVEPDKPTPPINSGPLYASMEQAVKESHAKAVAVEAERKALAEIERLKAELTVARKAKEFFEERYISEVERGTTLPPILAQPTIRPLLTSPARELGAVAPVCRRCGRAFVEHRDPDLCCPYGEDQWSGFKWYDATPISVP